jgi:hypothetical protein
VPFSRNEVENQVRLIAEQGRSLIDEHDKHWVWNQCYDILVKTETGTLIIVGSIKDPTSIEDAYQLNQGYTRAVVRMP